MSVNFHICRSTTVDKYMEHPVMLVLGEIKRTSKLCMDAELDLEGERGGLSHAKSDTQAWRGNFAQ